MNQAYYKLAEDFLKSYGILVITGLIDESPILLEDHYIEYSYSLN